MGRNGKVEKKEKGKEEGGERESEGKEMKRDEMGRELSAHARRRTAVLRRMVHTAWAHTPHGSMRAPRSAAYKLMA